MNGEIHPDSARLNWLERTQSALMPVEGNIMPPGTWCVEPPGVGEDDVSMGPSVRAAIDAAMAGEPVGAPQPEEA